MTENVKHIMYSKADIENYLQGKMSYEEMHLLELAALQDPFLADAVEGYTIANNTLTAKHLTEIETEILANRTTAKVVNINKKKRLGFLQIVAASAVIIVGIYSINLIVQKTDNTTMNIAVIEQKKLNLIDSNDIQNDNSKTKFDTLNKNNNLSTQSIVLDTKQKGSYSINKNNNSSDTFTYDNAQIAQAIVSNTRQEQDKSIARTDDAKDLDVETDSSLKNNITAKSNLNSITNTYTYTNADATKYLKPRSGYSNENAASNTVSLPTIKMKLDTSFKPIATTNVGYKAKKELKPITYKLTKEDSLAVPANGWTAFNDYVRNNTTTISITDTTKGDITFKNGRTSETIVDLEFLVDKDGKPENITVTNATNSATDTTAINLLKNGPRWITTGTSNDKIKNTGKKKAKVSIKLKN
jgi:hypothetical protein